MDLRRKLWGLHGSAIAGGVVCGVVFFFGLVAAADEPVDESVNIFFSGVDQNWSEGTPSVTRALAVEEPTGAISIHQAQDEEFGARSRKLRTDEQYDSLLSIVRVPLRATRAATPAGTLQKRVVGWHPYWMGTAYKTYNYAALSTIAYFSYEVNPTNGSYSSLRSWDTTALIPWAHSNNVKVVLTATCFGNSNCRRLLTNSTSCQNLINSLVSVVSNRGGDGVNIDFESISDSTLRPKVTEFMSNLTTRFHRDLPGSEVSIALPAVDWSNIFDVGAYSAWMDYCIIMGYDYHYRGSSTAGPVAPLQASSKWGAYCIEKSINDYLTDGIDANKLLLGCPYYGYDWPTADFSVPSATLGSGTAVLYPDAYDNAVVYGRQWDASSSTPYYFYTNSGARQCWYDDAQSLGLKYDMVISKGIGGIGIWALGYDETRAELWELIADKFMSAAAGWTLRYSGTAAGLYGVGYGSNNYVAVGASGTILKSSDAATWLTRTSGVSSLLLNVMFGRDRFVAVGDAGRVLTSSNGDIWTAPTSGITNMLRGIAYGYNTYVAVGNDGAIISSTDAVNWITRTSGTLLGLQGVTYATQFVAVGVSGTLLTSTDGAAWTARVSGTSQWLLDACYGAGRIVAVGLGGTIVTSTNGVSWAATSSGTSEHLYRVAFGDNRFVAVGPNGTIISSTNGLNWVAETSGNTNFLRGVICGGSTFAAVGYNGTVLTSGAGDPAVTITTLDATVPNGTTSYAISGVANANVTGQLSWSNNLGGAGVLAAATNWSVTVTGLSVGANTITVRGTNSAGQAASAQVVITRQSGGAGGVASGETTNQQPRGALTDIIIFTSAGHGFTASGSSWITGRGLTYGVVEDMGNIDQLNPFVEYCFNAGATVVPMRPVGYQTNEVVLDNDDSGVTFTGTWANSSSTIFFGTAGDIPYRYAYINTNGQSAVARYAPNIPSAGFYPVYGWARSGSDRVKQLYRIRHSGGVTEVRVNHRRVGLGWVWLGNYYFEAGTNGFVEISNYAPAGYNPATDVVIADAIRFGNGMGDVDRGYGVSGVERELEAARYWIQRALGEGMSATIYDLSGYSDSDDNVGAPVRMAAEMNRSDDGGFWDRIYLGFHSNADGGAGTGRGAMGLYDTRGTTTKQQLQQAFGYAVNNEVEADMEWADDGVVVADDWTDNSADMYGSAYGELYGTINDEMNSTIIEVAFHNNESDAKLLKDPAARNIMARACYQAIVRHLHATNAAVPLALLPDPPVNVRAVNSGVGQVTLSWSAPATNAAGGDAATGYQVYRSANGYGFGNPVAVAGAANTSLTLTNLTIGSTYYFRVTATNSGGESLPSEVTGARISPMGRAWHLVVNGFDRFERGLSPTRYFGYNLSGNVTLVRPRMINSQDYVVQHGQAISAGNRYFDACNHYTVLSNLISLADYRAAYWILGEESSAHETFSAGEQTRVGSFLDGGGCLLASGAELAWDLDHLGSAADKSFMTNYLRAAYLADDAGTYQVSARSGSIFNGISSFYFDSGNGTTYNAEYPDTLVARGGATTALVYGASGTNVAAIQFSNVFRVVTMGFPFETILNESDRSAVMAKVLTFFGDAPEEQPRLDITNSDATVDSGTAHYTIGGTNNAAVVGQLTWTNRLTGGQGTTNAAAAWQIAAIPISMGTNVIIVRGSNYLGTAVAADTVTVRSVATALGALRINLTPDEAADAGAQWRVDGGAWRGSGELASGLAAGTHTASFSTVSGWTNPGPLSVTIVNAQTTTASGVYTQLLAQGALVVVISPVEAIGAGAQWNVDGGAWRNSGAYVSNLVAGVHTVAFSSVSGWYTPSSQVVMVYADQTTASGGAYTRFQGALTVVLNPEEVIAAGAQWNVDGGAWQSSESILATLAVGIHTVAFSRVSGWTAPPTQTVAITTGQLTTASGTYTQQTGGLLVTLAPQGATDAGAQWRVDAGAWQNSAATVSNLSASVHTVSFNSAAGWIAPDALAVTIIGAAVFSTNALYQQDTVALGADNAQFVSETDPTSGAHIVVGASFTKSWTLKNTGLTTWSKAGGYRLQAYWEDPFGAAEFTDLADAEEIAPGATKTWTLNLVAPLTPGTYRGYWMMHRNGRFGDPVWVEVVVDPPGAADE